MNKYIVEVDTDGVLADMDGSYGPYITDIIPDFSEEKYIRGWPMPIIRDKYPNAHDIIKALWRAENPFYLYVFHRALIKQLQT